MLGLRPYKPCDAEAIAGWIKDELTLRRWSADRFGDFPVSAGDINAKYIDCNGDCAEPDNFFPMTAFDERGAVGSLIMRFVDGDARQTLRLGFVIIDDSRRGQGCGKELLRLALSYAFNILRVGKVTIGVFDNNPSALSCYRSVGFRECPDIEGEVCRLCGENWRVIEMELTDTDYFAMQ